MNQYQQIKIIPLTSVQSELAEGLFYDEPKKQLLWVDILGNHIYRYDFNLGKFEEWDCIACNIGAVGRYPSVIIPCQTPYRYLVSCWRNLYIWNSELNLIEKQLGQKQTTPISGLDLENRFNDGKCDPKGRLFIGSTDLYDRPGRSGFYRLNQSPPLPNELVQLKSNVSISNGIGWSPNGTQFYYIDTPQRRIMVDHYDLKKGQILETIVLFFDLKEYKGIPDGLTVDNRGHIWCCMWDGSQILEIDPKKIGRPVVGEIQLPVSRPTTCVFGGKNMDQLFVASARVDGEPLSGRILRVSGFDPEIKGIPGVYFEL